MANQLVHILSNLIEKKIESAQIALKGGGQPIGPGKVERLDAYDSAGNPADLYRILVRAQIGRPSAIPGQPPQLTEVCLPMTFCGDDVLWISEGPLDSDGNPMVIDPPRPQAPPPRNRGGLSIG